MSRAGECSTRPTLAFSVREPKTFSIRPPQMCDRWHMAPTAKLGNGTDGSQFRFEDGELLPLAKAAKNHSKFCKFASEEIREWAKSGYEGVRLECTKYRGKLCTTQNALNRFLSALVEGRKRASLLNKQKESATRLPRSIPRPTRAPKRRRNLKSPDRNATDSPSVKQAERRPSEAHKPDVKQYRAALQRRLQNAEKCGWSFVEINAGHLNSEVAPQSIRNRTMASCCEAMHLALRGERPGCGEE